MAGSHVQPLPGIAGFQGLFGNLTGHQGQLLFGKFNVQTGDSRFDMNIEMISHNINFDVNAGYNSSTPYREDGERWDYRFIPV
jgi:hypothetical protein